MILGLGFLFYINWSAKQNLYFISKFNIIHTCRLIFVSTPFYAKFMKGCTQRSNYLLFYFVDTYLCRTLLYDLIVTPKKGRSD